MVGEKSSVASKIFDILNYVILALLCVIMIYPLFYELCLSLSEARLLFGHSGFIIRPVGYTWDNYEMVFDNPDIISGFRNTLFILAVGLPINLVLTCLAAYFLSRRGMMLRKAVVTMIVITMYFGGGLIPSYVNVSELGLMNSLWALIIPGALSTSNAMVLSSFFKTIPDSIVESVEMDGGGHVRILFQFFVPLSTAAMAVMVLYYGVDHWNSWFNANIYLRDTGLFPLQLVLQRMLTEVSNNEALGISTDPFYEQLSEAVKAATVMVVTLPILCIYPLLQKYFVKGVMLGSLKE